MAKIAINIITGFLGSGKTTFLSEILQNNKEDIALLVNEFGESGLDNSILSSFFIEEETILLNQGCICCNIRQDLADKLKEILNLYHTSGKKLDKVVIETTGLATIEPILFTILSDTFLQNHFFVNAVFTCIDSLNAMAQINENEESVNQIISSDVLIITKDDLNSNTSELKEKLSSLNKSAKIYLKSEFCLDEFFKHRQEIKFYETNLKSYKHNENIQSLSISFEGELEWSAFGIWLSMLLYKYGDKILRVKGLLKAHKDYFISVNGVRHIVYPPVHIKKTKNSSTSTLVFISKSFDLNKVILSLQAFSHLLKIKINP